MLPDYISSDKATIRFFNCDNMEFMKDVPDKFYDLAIVDPEFGIGIGNSPRLVTDKGLKAKEWDNKPIGSDYFKQLFRISQNQIIWGGNYYPLPANKHCVIWDKKQPEEFSFGMFDYAWTSFDGSNKMFRYSVQKEQDKINPAQKPVQLYRWLLQNYAKPGQKIFDSHGGSFSSAIACDMEGFDLDIVELDPDYFKTALDRYKTYKSQLKLF